MEGLRNGTPKVLPRGVWKGSRKTSRNWPCAASLKPEGALGFSGSTCAAVFVLVNAVQIGITRSTWFLMLVLQALTVLIFAVLYIYFGGVISGVKKMRVDATITREQAEKAFHDTTVGQACVTLVRFLFG